MIVGCIKQLKQTLLHIYIYNFKQPYTLINVQLGYYNHVSFQRGLGNWLCAFICLNASLLVCVNLHVCMCLWVQERIYGCLRIYQCVCVLHWINVTMTVVIQNYVCTYRSLYVPFPEYKNIRNFELFREVYYQNNVI